MTLADWQPLFQALIALLAAVMTGLITLYVPRVVAAFEAWTGQQASALQVQALHDAANTAKGVIETQLQQGLIRLSEVTPTNPKIIEQAKTALASVPTAAAVQGTTVATMSRIIVARTDTAPKPIPAAIGVTP